MFIEKVRVENFGPIENIDIHFNSTGITIISGDNGSGKTQLVGAILFALLGENLNNIKFFHNNISKLHSKVELTLCEKEVKQDLSYEVIPNDSADSTPEIRRSNKQTLFTSGKQYLHSYILRTFADLNAPRFLFPEEQSLKIDSPIGELFGNIEDDIELYDWQQHIKESVINSVSDLNSLSSSDRQILQVLQELKRRRDTNITIPLIMDESLPRLFGVKQREYVIKLLQLIGKKDQIILLTTHPENLQSILSDTENHIRLQRSENSIKSLIGVSYTFAFPVLYEKFQEQAANVQASLIEELKTIFITNLHDMGHKFNNSIQILHQDIQDIKSDVSSVLELLAELNAKVEVTKEQLSEKLENALVEDDEILVNRICGEISQNITNILRKEIKADLSPYYKQLQDELQDEWNNFHQLSQKDVALSLYIEKTLHEHGIHLAILAISRAIENEILTKVFMSFMRELEDAEIKKICSMSQLSNGKWKRTYNSLRAFVLKENRRLTIGEFAWIAKMTEANPDDSLTSYFLKHLKSLYGENSTEVIQLLQQVYFFKDDENTDLKQSIGCIRNQCAHPTSLAGDTSNILDLDTYNAICRYALREPVKFLLKISNVK